MLWIICTTQIVLGNLIVARNVIMLQDMCVLRWNKVMGCSTVVRYKGNDWSVCPSVSSALHHYCTPYNPLSNLFSIVNGWPAATATHSETVTDAMTLSIPPFPDQPCLSFSSWDYHLLWFLQGKWTTILTLSFKPASGLNNPRKSSGSQQTEAVLFYSCDDVMISEERKWLPSKQEDPALHLLMQTRRLVGAQTLCS